MIEFLKPKYLGSGKYKAEFQAGEEGAKWIFDAISNQKNTVLEVTIGFKGCKIKKNEKIEGQFKAKRKFNLSYPCEQYPELFYDKDINKKGCPNFDSNMQKALVIESTPSGFHFFRDPYSVNQYYFLPSTYKLYRHHEDQIPVIYLTEYENKMVHFSFSTLPFVSREKLKEAIAHIKKIHNVENPVLVPIADIKSAKMKLNIPNIQHEQVEIDPRGFTCDLELTRMQYLEILPKLKMRTGITGNVELDIDDSQGGYSIGFGLNLDDLMGNSYEITDVKRGDEDKGWIFTVKNIIESHLEIKDFDVEYYKPNTRIFLKEVENIQGKVLRKGQFVDFTEDIIPPGGSATYYIEPSEPNEEYDLLIIINPLDVKTDYNTLLDKLSSSIGYEFKFSVIIDTPVDFDDNPNLHSLDVNVKYKNWKKSGTLRKGETEKDIEFSLPLSQVMEYDPNKTEYEFNVVANYKEARKTGNWKSKTANILTVYPEDAEP